MKNYFHGRFKDWRFYFSKIYLLKVIDISNLGGDSNTFTIAESFLPKVSNSLLGICNKTTEEKKAADESSCTTFTVSAMDNHYIIWIL